MHPHPPRLFSRIRRQRGLWVLALAVLLFKLTMATFCLLDAPRVASLADGNIAVATAEAGPGDTCVLDEGAGCHCSCAHNVAMPAALPAVLAGVPHSHVAVKPDAVLVSAYTRSPLRPPIA
ncbi:hypothetical protein [Luteibacter sp. ME-Dv--P-043b]|uniref:hypothetical protein n=1 Tax=unclassified Luteibacter TaxID=2620188 RepID=UPI00255495FB|nr:hypothetical protein [Luteibacter sp. ME-Dv--P-043b]